MLVADSGATKCSWALLKLPALAGSGRTAVGEEVLRFGTGGLNAAVATMTDIREFASKSAAQLCLSAGPEMSFPEDAVSLSEDSASMDGLHSPLEDAVEEVCIYAAGVASGKSIEEISHAFGIYFRNAEVHVESDMLGAARAVCGSEPGIVGILGTGSNSCLYDGTGIAVYGLGGGYVLGDEGSGAWVGKRLLSDFIRSLLPSEMSEALKRDYSLDYPTIVDKLYRGGTPGRYLASFFPFVLGYAWDSASSEYARDLLREGFGAFMDRCILKRYDCAVYPLNLCGSVAWLCRDIIAECADMRGIRIGTVLKSPIEGLVKYHQLIFEENRYDRE